MAGEYLSIYMSMPSRNFYNIVSMTTINISSVLIIYPRDKKSH